MRKHWTTKEDNKIINNKLQDESWETFTKRELPHRTPEAVRLHSLRYLNINNNDYRHRKYFFNKNIWKKLTPENCYWAGFIAADGCLINCKNRFTLCIDLQKSDNKHLFLFKNFVNYTGPLQKTRNQKNSKTQSIRINIGNSWINDLQKNFNITPKKTHNLQPPNITDEYLKWCYIIGFIDGDGTIGVSKNNKKIHLQIIGASQVMAHWIQNQFNNLTEKSFIRRRKRKVAGTNKYYRGGLYGLPACAAIDYLRQFPVPKLDRKWNKSSVIDYIKKQKEKYPDKFINYTYN